jgi:enamine deaminase RidA (YjgF/YER057c/UK114 family)
MTYDQIFLSLGSEIPPQAPSVPAGLNFVLYKQVGNVLHLSGYGPFWGNDVAPGFSGKLGSELTKEQGYAAARLTAINLLMIVREAIGTLDNVQEILEVTGFVNSTDAFTDQPFVINGCSDLLGFVFGDAGKHIRAAIGTNTLAFNLSVEISISLILAE